MTRQLKAVTSPVKVGAVHNPSFPFILNGVMMAIFAVVVIIFRKSFVFEINKSYYE